MEVFRWIGSHWDSIIAIIGTVAAALGIRRQVSRLQPTWEQVEPWVNAAADATIIWMRAAKRPIDQQEIVNQWRGRLLEFAAALGLTVAGDMMRRATAEAVRRFNSAAIDNPDMAPLAEAAEAMRAKLVNGSVAPITRKETKLGPGSVVRPI